jgi:hypothetical protein
VVEEEEVVVVEEEEESLIKDLERQAISLSRSTPSTKLMLHCEKSRRPPDDLKVPCPC